MLKRAFLCAEIGGRNVENSIVVIYERTRNASICIRVDNFQEIVQQNTLLWCSGTQVRNSRGSRVMPICMVRRYFLFEGNHHLQTVEAQRMCSQNRCNTGKSNDMRKQKKKKKNNCNGNVPYYILLLAFF